MYNRYIAFVAMLLILGNCGNADQILLKDGRTFEGTIESQTPTQIFLKMRIGGSMTINRSDISSINKEQSPAAIFIEKVAHLKSSDAEGLLKLGKWAESQKLVPEAFQCFQRAARVASPHYKEAVYHSGLLAREMRDYVFAAKCFRELSERYKHKDAWLALTETERRLRKERLLFVGKAQDKEKLGYFFPAMELYLQALRLSLSEKDGGENDPGSQSLRAMILRCRIAHAAEVEKARFRPVPLSPCGTCGGSGIGECRNCRGTGKVTIEGKVSVDLTTGEKFERKEIVNCPDCNGSGRARCGKCQGFGSNVDAFNALYQQALFSLGRCGYAATESGLVMQVQNILFQVKTYGSHMPAQVRASYGAARSVRDGLTSFPPAKDAVSTEANNAWLMLDRDARRRFLIALGLEVATWANTRVLMTDRGGVHWPFEPLPKNIYARARQVSLETLRVNPEAYAGQWIKLVGTISPSSHGADVISSAFQVGPEPHPDLLVYAWNDSAKARHAWWAAQLDKEDRYFHELTASYPYTELASEMRHTEQGEPRVLYGRVRVRRDITPFTLFETWAMEPVADPAQATLVDTLREEVSVSFVETPLSEVVEFLSMVARTDLVFDEMPEIRITLDAQKSQLGKVLADLGKKIGKTWVPVGSSVAYRSKPTKEELAAKKQLIRLASGE